MPKAKNPTKSKDLPPRKSGTVKGGKLATNENLTLVRAQ